MLTEGEVGLLLGAVLFAGSFVNDRAARRLLVGSVLAVWFLAMLRVSLRLPVPMGDYYDFAGQGQDHFAGYFDEAIQFQYHLGGALIRVFDAWYGKTDSSPAAAFGALSRLAAFVLTGSLAGFAWFQDWSQRVLRYLALAVAMPTMILFFGYHEFGYLPVALDAAAIPLLLVALEERRRRLLLLAGLLAGIGSAFHGYGLVALGFLVVVALAYLAFDREARTKLGWWSVVDTAGAGLVGWLGWLAVYMIGFGIAVTPGHSDESPIRPLLHAHYSDYYHRLDRPIFSWHVLGQIGWELWVGSAVLMLLLARERGPLVRSVAIGTLPVLAFLIVFWPVQGIGNDSDLLGAVFPAAFAGAWLISRSARLTLVGLLLLVSGQWAIHHVLTPGFVEDQTPPPG